MGKKINGVAFSYLLTDNDSGIPGIYKFEIIQQLVFIKSSLMFCYFSSSENEGSHLLKRINSTGIFSSK
jgi:hypothetical protein